MEREGDGTMTRTALWYVARGRADLIAGPLPLRAPGEALCRARFSTLSRGTERLVFEGRVPFGEWARMACPRQEGAFPFPVKYGYAMVATVEDGPADLIGRTVFALNPHEDRFTAPADALVPVPDAVPARRAVLAPNMETALNGVWDSGVSAGESVVIVGAGVVGLLVAALVSRIPGTTVTLVDIDPTRRDLARAMGAGFAKPLDAPDDADVVFHTSATAAGLSCALACAGFEARVVELSWYGDADPPVPLGAAFHARRLQLVSSQVGSVAASRRARFSHRRRLETALSLLADPRYDALLDAGIAFADLPAALPALLGPGASGLPPVIHYPA